MKYTAISVLVASIAIVCLTVCASPPVEKSQAEPATIVKPEKSEPLPVRPPEPKAEPKPTASNYTATKEEYEKTFLEVEGVIKAISAFIRAGNFAEWQQYLTKNYIDRLLDPENLNKMNEQPIIKKQNVIIRTLDDYFVHVVVPSRVNARLDEIVFADARRVEALMKIGDSKFLLYQLEKVGDTWKIGVW
jgi:hypothetical protein